MNKQQARQLVERTLEHPFDKNKFVYLTKNLLNNIEPKPFHIKGVYVPETSREHVKSYERIGTYTDPEDKRVDLLIVYLQGESSVERARASQRNFIARYLKERGEKDAALVAFVSPNSDDWRFSFIKMDYKFEETTKGTVKVKEEFTPAKRYSFLVGKNENSHTAQSRLAPLLQRDECNPKLNEIEELFNIEKATKEFFEKYRELYHRTHEALERLLSEDNVLKAEFKDKSVGTVDFCKKLLGQIVFLYFLQRKGWFGVPLHKPWGEGDKRFLRSSFEHAQKEKKNYFNDYLEPLFYEALGRDRTDDYYSRFECRIPFLNGGLFDPINNYDWVNTAINLSNDLFSNKNLTKEGDIGDGILDVFDRFNFTVKEDEPLEKEVAVDPEMLGKVFENLLEVKDRKSKGTYYTPREIVHYMCVQSLLNYLTTELKGKVSRDDLEQLIKYGDFLGENEARVAKKGEETATYYYKLPESIREHARTIDSVLTEIKVCDPAIGSGAFPVGMMMEIVRTRNVLSAYCPNSQRTIYNFKRHCIHNSLYGIDVDPGAIEIAKLRLWLSLIVDEEDIKQIKPLPNLDYKIMQGNSLLEEYEGIGLFDDRFIAKNDLDNESIVARLKEKQRQLQSEYIELLQNNNAPRTKQAELKAELNKIALNLKKLNKSDTPRQTNDLFDRLSDSKQKANKLKRLHDAFFDTIHKKEKDLIKKEIEVLEWELIDATLREQGKIDDLARVEEFKRSNTKPFFLWKLNFPEVFQNKGGFDVVIANPPYIGEKNNKIIFHQVKHTHFGKMFYQRRMDYFYFFIAKGIMNLKHGGHICFITTNYWITATGGQKYLRPYLKNNSVICSFVDFGEYKIFEAAQGQHNCIFVMMKDGVDDATHPFVIRVADAAQAREYELDKIIDNEMTINGVEKYYAQSQHDLYDPETFNINFCNNESATLINKILKNSDTSLGSICDVSGGVSTSADKVRQSNIKHFSTNEINRKGIALGDGIFVLSKDELDNLALPTDEREFIKPYYKSSEIERYVASNEANKYLIYAVHSNAHLIKKTKVLYKHFVKYKPILEARSQDIELATAMKKGHWFVMTNGRPRINFDVQKIVCPYRAMDNIFAFNNKPWYAGRDVYFLINMKIDTMFLLGLLNSRLMRFWLEHKGKKKGNIFEFYPEPLRMIPICYKNNDCVKEIARLTKNIVTKKTRDRMADTADAERKIDQQVYELYELTGRDIEYVERKK